MGSERGAEMENTYAPQAAGWEQVTSLVQLMILPKPMATSKSAREANFCPTPGQIHKYTASPGPGIS